MNVFIPDTENQCRESLNSQMFKKKAEEALEKLKAESINKKYVQVQINPHLCIEVEEHKYLNNKERYEEMIKNGDIRGKNVSR